jgi:hypothetical protein
MEYLVLKWLHILGAMVIFGTGLGTAFHFWITQRREGVAAIAAAARSTVLADYLFTLPAVILQPLTGFALAAMAGYSLTSTWIVAAFVLSVGQTFYDTTSQAPGWCGANAHLIRATAAQYSVPCRSSWRNRAQSAQQASPMRARLRGNPRRQLWRR